MARTPIYAAGGIVVRGGATPLIAVVQRSKDDAWVLPRGKLKRDENPIVGARREALEETGHRVKVHEFLGAITYRARGRPKVVQFWRMQAYERPSRDVMRDIVAVRVAAARRRGAAFELPAREIVPAARRPPRAQAPQAPADAAHQGRSARRKRRSDASAARRKARRKQRAAARRIVRRWTGKLRRACASSTLRPGASAVASPPCPRSAPVPRAPRQASMLQRVLGRLGALSAAIPPKAFPKFNRRRQANSAFQTSHSGRYSAA